MDIFKTRLKELRLEHNADILDLCKLLGIKERAYRYYESGERHPDFYGLIALADFFEVSLDYLVGRSDKR